MENQRSSDGDVEDDTQELRTTRSPRPGMTDRAILHSNTIRRRIHRREDDARYQLNKCKRYVVSSAPPKTYGPYTKEFLSESALWYLQKDIPWSKTEKLQDITARRDFAAKVKEYAFRHGLTKEFKDAMEDMNLNDLKEIVKEREHKRLSCHIGIVDGTGDLEPYMGDDEKGLISKKSGPAYTLDLKGGRFYR